jgi:hypothetical protein
MALTPTERMRRWRERNPAKARENERAYEDRHREERRAEAARRQRERRAKDPDKDREYQRAWRKANPDKV